jgi:uncharacterized protein YjbI with pentapeptide repeats
LCWADLQQADLRGANLAQADLSDANLSQAQLDGVDLSNTKYNSQTQWPEEFTPSEEETIHLIGHR